MSDGGYGISVDRNFAMPDHLADGDYEMGIISRDDEKSPWVRGWDNAPNRIPVTVKNNVYTFYLPNYHTLDTYLYLEGGNIKEVPGITSDGKVLELTVCNPSDNNFEDSLRVVVTAKGKTLQYNMVTSIYEGQKITYRFLISNSEINTDNGYTAEAYYKEVNTDKWMRLKDKASDIRAAMPIPFNGVEIYTVGGKLIKRIDKMDIDSSYSQYLSQLPKGIYIIRDKNSTRKYVKQN